MSLLNEVKRYQRKAASNEMEVLFHSAAVELISALCNGYQQYKSFERVTRKVTKESLNAKMQILCQAQRVSKLQIARVGR